VKSVDVVARNPEKRFSANQVSFPDDAVHATVERAAHAPAYVVVTDRRFTGLCPRGCAAPAQISSGCGSGCRAGAVLGSHRAVVRT
jgi:hypothetical protein